MAKKITPVMTARAEFIKAIEARGFKDMSHVSYKTVTGGIRDSWFWHEPGLRLRVVISVNQQVHLRIYTVGGRVSVVEGTQHSLLKEDHGKIIDRLEVLISATRQFEAMVTK